MITTKIIVLNDGETWSGVKGSVVLEITPKALQKLNEGGSPKDLDNKDIVGGLAWEEELKKRLPV